jgi:hypothetical protein
VGRSSSVIGSAGFGRRPRAVASVWPTVPTPSASDREWSCETRRFSISVGNRLRVAIAGVTSAAETAAITDRRLCFGRPERQAPSNSVLAQPHSGGDPTMPGPRRSGTQLARRSPTFSPFVPCTVAVHMVHCARFTETPPDGRSSSRS